MVHPLTKFAVKLISKIDNSHPSCNHLNLNHTNQESLIRDVAAAVRKGIVCVGIDRISNEASKNKSKIGRENETPEQLIRRCQDGYWISVGREFYFPSGLNYNANPDPALNTKGVPFGEWTWQLNRHQEWNIAARLYKQTKDEKYAKIVASWLSDWITQCPAPSEDLNTKQGSWRTIEIGIRMGIVWPQVLSAFKDSPSFDDTLLLAWLNVYDEQSNFVWKYKKENNWLLMEMNGLLHAGVQLPFMKGATGWKNNALNEFLKQVKVQFQPDGFQRELSTHYMLVCVHNYLKPINLLKSAGLDVPRDLLIVLSNMYNSWRKLARTNGIAFGFQDGPDENLGEHLKMLPEELLIEGDRWFMDGTGSPPKEKNSFLENSGYVVLRSGWGQDDICLAFDGGPLGDSHQHEDKLSIQLFAHGKTLIGEAGTVDYSDTPERRYSLETLAHSTAIIDGKYQNRSKNYIKGSRPIDALADTICHFNSEQPSASAVYSEGYGKDLEIKVTHTRTVKLLNKENVEITDEFEAQDSIEHTVEILYHILMDEATTIDGGALGRNNDGLTLSIQAKTIDDIQIKPEIKTGGDKPDLRGWAAPDVYTKGYWALVPRPCLTLKFSFKNKSKLISIIKVNPT